MKNIKKLICYIFGHNYDSGALDNGYFWCRRCKHEDSDGEEFYTRYYRAKFKIKDVLRNWKWKIRNWWKYKIKKENDDVPF